MEKELINNSQSNIYPFHMPGHKRRGSDIGAELDPYAIDITEIDNFDNLHHAEGIIKEAQAEAAALYGAKHAYFLINGSTCGILAAISAATKRGDKVLVARNCHKAVYHALYLRQLHPVFTYPEITRTGLQGQITEAQIRAAFDENPDIKAVVITSPTYDGVVSDMVCEGGCVGGPSQHRTEKAAMKDRNALLGEADERGVHENLEHYPMDTFSMHR